MRVCLATPYFAPARGGVETYTLQMCTHLRDEYKHDVFVITTRSGPGMVRVEERAGFKTYTLPTSIKLSNTPVSLDWRRKLSGIFAIEQPDVINAHTPVPFLADMAERARGPIPFVLTVHNDIEKSTFLGKLIGAAYYRVLGNKTLEHSDSIVATSDYYVDTSRRLSAQRSKLSIATCGVDTDLFHPQSPDNTVVQADYEGRRIVLFVGTMDATHAHKGLDILIRSIAQLRDRYENILLLAVGKGDAIPRYQKLANDLGLNNHILFPGPVENAELAECYRSADVCVLPSINRSEGLGLVLIEASACQTPTIGTRVGGIPCAILDNRTGLLVLPADVKALAGAIDRILSDSTFATSLGVNGLRHVKEHFTWRASAEAMNNVLVRTVYDHRKECQQ
ncbi:LPS biosynthesis rfbu related protein [Ktedonobacteria bacterium brp13]|nr:LPS biosynthesis rfbu related protein [Ktedonobacteria bacterium brp13]